MDINSIYNNERRKRATEMYTLETLNAHCEDDLDDEIITSMMKLEGTYEEAGDADYDPFFTDLEQEPDLTEERVDNILASESEVFSYDDLILNRVPLSNTMDDINDFIEEAVDLEVL